MRKPLAAACVILAAVLAAYWATFRVPFLLDDQLSVVDNASIRKLWAFREVISPPADSTTGGRPVANVSFAVSYAISGLETWGYHLLNLALHTFVALLLFGVVRRTMLSHRLRGRFWGNESFLAGAIALLWAVHPLQTQTVTYISQRTESLMAFFYLLTIYCFIRGIEGRAKLWHACAVVACVLGAMSKEVIVTVPVLVLLYDRTFVSGSFRAAVRLRWRFYAGLAASWLLVAWLLLDVKARGVGFDIGVTSFQYALTQCKAVVLYLWLGLWPHPLVFDYGSPLLGIGAALPYAAVLACLLAASCWALVRWPACGFVAAWFFVILAPVSSIVPVTGATIAENRPYLSLAAVVTLMVVGLHALLGRRAVRFACIFLAIAGMLATAGRNRDYQDAVYLWSDTVLKAPQSHRAHNSLGLLLAREQGRQAEARGHFETALRLKPDLAEAHNNLGAILASQPGNANEALAHYEAALRLKPNFAEAHDNLGMLFAGQPGRQAEAHAHFQAALRLKPDEAKLHFDFANFLAQQPGRQAEALGHYETALRLKPDYAEAHNNLGDFIAGQPGRQAEALRHFETALRLQPRNAIIHLNVAEQLEKSADRQQEALAHFSAALAIDPNLAGAKAGLERLRKADRR